MTTLPGLDGVDAGSRSGRTMRRRSSAVRNCRLFESVGAYRLLRMVFAPGAGGAAEGERGRPEVRIGSRGPRDDGTQPELGAADAADLRGRPAAVPSVQRGDADRVGDPGGHGRRPALGASAEDRWQRSSRGDGAAWAAGRDAGVTWRGRVTTDADGSLPTLTLWA